MEPLKVMTQKQCDQTMKRAWLRAAEAKRCWWLMLGRDVGGVHYFYIRHWATGQLIG